MTESNLVHFLAKHQKNRSRQLTRAVLFLSMEMRGESNLVHFLAKHQKNRSRQLTRAVLFLSMEMRGFRN